MATAEAFFLPGISRRRWAAVLAVCLIVGLVVSVPSPAAAAEPCENSNDYSTQVAPRCINKVMLTSRGRGLMDDARCLIDGPGLPIGAGRNPYRKRQCGGNGLGVEAIGQARAVAYLNRMLRIPGENTPGIIPDVQWEVVINGKRADIVYYNRRNTTFVDVIEAKLTTNSDFNQWRDQLDNKYIGPLGAKGMANVDVGLRGGA